MISAPFLHQPISLPRPDLYLDVVPGLSTHDRGSQTSRAVHSVHHPPLLAHDVFTV